MPEEPSPHVSPAGNLAGVTRREVLILAALWVLAIGILLWFRPGYPFPPFGVLDSWVYTGYQWNLSGHLEDFGPL